MGFGRESAAKTGPLAPGALLLFVRFTRYAREAARRIRAAQGRENENIHCPRNCQRRAFLRVPLGFAHSIEANIVRLPSMSFRGDAIRNRHAGHRRLGRR